MKLKVLILAAVFVAGLTASLALAAPSKHEKGSTDAQTTTGESKKPKCEQAELKGTATGSTFAFAVTKANKRGASLVGTSVDLVIPAGARVKAKVCTSAGGLTLRDLHVKVKPAKP
jgi:predicted secreted protein